MNHLSDPVVHSEFLSPIYKILEKENNGYMFNIHGMKKGDPTFVLGYGLGKNTSSLTMTDIMVKNIYLALEKEFGETVYFGAPGGNYAARSKDNLTQLFRLHRPNNNIMALQIEIAADFRQTEQTAKTAGLMLAQIISTTNFFGMVKKDSYRML